MRLLSCLAVVASLAPACATASLRCPPADEVCARVRQQIEVVRAHAEQPTDLAIATARVEMTRLGAAAVPYLVRALDDDEGTVAQFAARVLLESGHERELTEWCQGSTPNTEAFCGSAHRPRH